MSAEGGPFASAYRPLQLDEPAPDLARFARLRQVLNASDLAGAAFFDPPNIRDATGASNMRAYGLHYARRRRATVERRSLTPGGGRVSTALTGIGSDEAALGLSRETALPPFDGPYSPIESGAPHSSADTQGAQRSFGGIRRTAPRQRSQLLLTLWLWTHLKNASSSASSTCQ